MKRAVVVLCVLLVASSAAAFRPSARWLIDRAMDKQIDRAVRNLKVEQESVTVAASGELSPPMAERLYLLAPGSVHREIETPNGLRVEVQVGDKLLVKAPGQPDKLGKAPADIVIDFLAAGAPLDRDTAGERLLKDMKALGVNLEVVSLARFDGKVAYLVGSKPWELDKSQIWLDKDSLALMRVVVVGKGARVDMRLLGYGSAEGGSWFPKTLETWVDDKLVRRSVTRSVDKNIAMDAGLFDLKR